MLWLEHAASVFQSAGAALDSVLLLNSAVRYLDAIATDTSTRPVRMLLLHSTASLLLGSSVFESAEPVEADKSEQRGWKRVRESLIEHAGDAVRRAAHSRDASVLSNATIWCLQEMTETGASAFASQLCTHKSFVPLVIRCSKKSVTAMYNLAISGKLSGSPGVQELVVARCAQQCEVLFPLWLALFRLLAYLVSLDKVAEALNTIRAHRDNTEPDVANVEALILHESKTRRMIVTLAAHSLRDSSSTDASYGAVHLSLVAKQVALTRQILDDAMADPSSDSLLQSLLMDINGIARECYSCAGRFYKQQELQPTIVVLRAAFELAESYMEYVMSSSTTTTAAIQRAHSKLKVDAIASLLAFCLHEEKQLAEARACVGFSILYSSDVHERVPLKAIAKYIAALFEELQDGQRDAGALRRDFEAFVDNLVHAFNARSVCKSLVCRVVQSFRRCLDLTSTRLLEKMRVTINDDTTCNIGGAGVDHVKLCADCDEFLSRQLLQLHTSCSSRENASHSVRIAIPRALSARKVSYAAYYAKTNSAAETIDALAHTHRLLSGAILSHEGVALLDKVDAGGAFGWRGVLGMEIILLTSYSDAERVMTGDGRQRFADISEEAAIRDVEECVRCWESVVLVSASTSLFDEHSMALCLEAVCNSLSLLSCSYLEKATRKLLEKIQRVDTDREDGPCAWPPPSLELLSLAHNESVGAEDAEADAHSAHAHNWPSFQQIDGELGLSVHHHSKHDRGRAVGHLQRVMTLLRELKASSGGCGSKAALVKTVGTRELLVHLILSNVHFADGHGTLAIREAKAALSICWKLAKKFATANSHDDVARFTLPDEIGGHSAANSDSPRAASLIFFKALEFSSWDILHAAKLVLCRIGTLYSLMGQPQRCVLLVSYAWVCVVHSLLSVWMVVLPATRSGRVCTSQKRCSWSVVYTCVSSNAVRSSSLLVCSCTPVVRSKRRLRCKSSG